ncbi:Sugar phosphate permease [Sulfobacillus thermosulfidooxidans DSM 9293]|uniref:Sugar phosphate permease n=1 Tax=Sulfobacillus thermosulfidooxidans (strain DSM 9293 / VKM B-1269 / AT-1) TaxID=929705 RepID=A0A1W1WEY1_SULTA|nr:MFS transporter [Sulfobacillus thermosulfidooxidans]SMC04826.1 Sugar phosphate permease [Sulfobacillus thermosulfidooxidans DSM 9293]
MTNTVNVTSSPGRTRWRRIIPVAFLMYTIAYMDRINVGFGFDGMEKGLHISASTAGLAGGIFFFGYLFLQIPGGYIASKFSAKKFVFASLLVWGVFAVLTGLVQNKTELLVVRFLLGVAEGGVWPATLVLLSHWFPQDERARANMYWMFCLPAAAIIMAPLSGLIVQHLSWRYLFVLEGIPPFIWAIVWWIFIDDSPDTASFISPEERAYLQKKFQEDRAAAQDVSPSWKKAFTNPKVWLLVGIYFLVQVGFYGFALWLPTVIKNLTKTGFTETGLVTALPYLAALIVMWINANHSDKTGERKAHVALPLIFGGLALLGSTLTTQNILVSLIFLILTEAFMLPYIGVFWTLPPLLVTAEGLGPTMGLINGIGNLGGFFGPFIVGALITATHSTFAGLVTLTGVLIVAGLLVFSLPVHTPHVGKVTTKPVLH